MPYRLHIHKGSSIPNMSTSYDDSLLDHLAKHMLYLSSGGSGSGGGGGGGGGSGSGGGGGSGGDNNGSG